MARKKLQEEEVMVPVMEEEMGPQTSNLGVIDEDDVTLADEEIFPGGPTYNDVEKWKSQYGDEVFLTEIDENNIFVWRPIKRKEYKDIQKIQNADAFYKEERICDKVVLYPKNYGHMHMANGKAGIPTLLSELIMEKSGFVARTGAMRIS